jgi:hypothetical protein
VLYASGVKPVACHRLGDTAPETAVRVSAKEARAFFVSLSGRRGCPDGCWEPTPSMRRRVG